MMTLTRTLLACLALALPAAHVGAQHVPAQPEQPATPVCDEPVELKPGGKTTVEGPACFDSNLGHVTVKAGTSACFTTDSDGNITDIDLGDDGEVRICCGSGGQFSVSGGANSEFTLSGEGHEVKASMSGGTFHVAGNNNGVQNINNGTGGTNYEFSENGTGNGYHRGGETNSLSGTWTSIPPFTW